MAWEIVAAVLGGVAAGSGLFGGLAGMAGSYREADYYEQAAQMMRKQQDYLRIEARQKEKAYLAQAETHEFNATQYGNQAEMSLLAGEYNKTQAERESVRIQRATLRQASEISEQGTKLMGSQVVGYLNSGVTLEGTPALVLAETEEKVDQAIADTLEAGDYEALDAVQRGVMSELQGLAAAGQARAGAVNSLGQGIASLSEANWVSASSLKTSFYLTKPRPGNWRLKPTLREFRAGKAYSAVSQASLARLPGWPGEWVSNGDTHLPAAGRF